MKLKEGYLYHIKSELFILLNDKELMQNKDNNRPTYFVIKDDKYELYWFVPLSTKVDKYKKLRMLKIKKYKKCNTILIKKIGRQESAILIQNAFPTLAKYVDHIHEVNGKPLLVVESLKELINKNFKSAMIEYKRGNKQIFFSDIEKDMKIMLEELNKKKMDYLTK